MTTDGKTLIDELRTTPAPHSIQQLLAQAALALEQISLEANSLPVAERRKIQLLAEGGAPE